MSCRLSIIIILFSFLCQDTYGNDTLRIYFTTGKSNTDNNTTMLLRGFLKQYSKGDMLLVTGYADEPGSITDNNILSRNRALAIKKLLLQLGIPADNISTAGKGIVTRAGDRKEDRRAELVIKPACDPDHPGETLDIYFPFDSIRASACELKQILKMAEQLDFSDGAQLHLTFYKICPICRADSTIPPAFYPLLEAAALQDQRRATIRSYLQEHNADMLKVYYHDAKVCFKDHPEVLKDSSSIIRLLDQQRRTALRLSGL